MNNFVDFQAQAFRDYCSVQPSDVHGVYNNATQFYKNQLYTKLYSLFEFTIPKTWKMNWLRFFLFQFGSIGVIYTKEFGWIAQPYGVSKLDINMNPAQITVSNALLPEVKTGVIGVNAGIIHCFDNYRGFDDIVTRYAEKLAQIDKSLDINLMNVNVALSAAVENKKQADEMREAYARATQGEPFVPINKDAAEGGFELLFGSVPFIADKLSVLHRQIMNEFLTEIGIRNANYEKKERLNSQEVSENNDETRAIISVVYDNIKADIDAINEISDLNLSVKLRYDYEVAKEVAENE